MKPLFNASGTERELLAVDSENKKNLQNDYLRIRQLKKNLSDSAHPYHKFSTGNYETLGVAPRNNNVDIRNGKLFFLMKRNYQFL